MLQADKDALRVVHLVNHTYTKLSEDTGKVGNLFLLFAHDLVIHFTGILLHRSAQSSYEDDVPFPFVSKNYAEQAYLFPSLGNAHNEDQNGLGALVRELALSRVAVGHALPLGAKKEWLISKIIGLFGCSKPFTRAFLPRHDIQIDALNEWIQIVCREFDIEGRKIIWHNWHRHVLKHTTQKQETLLENGLIVGTRNNLHNRKLAINYLQQSKEVVAVTHGEVANSVMDEPPFGYSERSLCSTLIDYGQIDESGEYNRPWIPPHRTLFRSGGLSRQIYRPDSEIRFSGKKGLRGLYIPTIYHGNTLYGPFHVVEDEAYRLWHRILFKAVERLTFKVHPKSRSAPITGIATEQRRLEHCIEDYDYLIFDYFATGAMLGLMSAQPVIYLDIGLRNLHPKFLADLKKRCEYVKIDLQNIDEEKIATEVRNILSSTRLKTNEVIEKYVFCPSSNFSWYDLFRDLNSGKSQSRA